MAGDWIKMRANLRRHPKVVRIASALNADRLRVVGGLHAVWCLFDEHSDNGQLCGYTPSALDDEVGFHGLADAMMGIGWLNSDGNDGLSLPHFDMHNGSSAKRRAQEADRKRADRVASAADPEIVRKASASDADKKRTREEKRREEKKETNTTPLPPRGEGRFAEFWDAWPKTDRKQDRKKCSLKWRANGWDDQADEILAHVISSKATRKWLEGFEPAPLTYLNGERWKDGPPQDRQDHQPAGGALSFRASDLKARHERNADMTGGLIGRPSLVTDGLAIDNIYEMETERVTSR